MEMSIHQALSELKLLQKRIEDSISNAKFTGIIKGKEKNVKGTNKSEINFKIESKAELESIKDLIKRRNEIKSKIVLSNATTEIMVGENEYTVAEAIERKASIEFEKGLLFKLNNQYRAALRDIESENLLVERQLEQQIAGIVGKDKDNNNMDLVNGLTKKYQEERKYRLVDGIGLEETIKELKKSIEDFESQVDFALSISNSLTNISVED